MATHITTLYTGDAQKTESKSFARYMPTVARFLMGLMFLVFGLNGFLNFIPAPPDLSAGVVAFDTAMMKTGYMFQLISLTQLVVGALLLVNRFVPLALALIAPVLVNILLFHLFLAPSSIVPGVVLTALELYLAWVYRDAFRPMLAAHVAPATK